MVLRVRVEAGILHIALLLIAASSKRKYKMPSSTPDPILLSLFANRFMSVAEAMGTSLRQVSHPSRQIDHPMTRSLVPTDSNLDEYKRALRFQLRTLRA